MPEFYEWQGNDLLLRLKIQEKASKNEFCEVMGDSLNVRINAPPVDGKANSQLIKFLAKQFKASKSQIELISGDTHREKRFKISRPSCIPESMQAANK